MDLELHSSPYQSDFPLNCSLRFVTCLKAQGHKIEKNIQKIDGNQCMTKETAGSTFGVVFLTDFEVETCILVRMIYLHVLCYFGALILEYFGR